MLQGSCLRQQMLPIGRSFSMRRMISVFVHRHRYSGARLAQHRAHKGPVGESSFLASTAPRHAKALRVDEAHTYCGLAKYTEEGRSVLGRIYIVMARRKTLAWRLPLSIERACFDGMPEETV